MNESTYLTKYIIFLNTLSLYVNNLKRMYGDYSNMSMEDSDAYDNVYGELQSRIDLLKLIPKQEIKDDKKEVVETLNFYNEILSDSDLDRLNKMIEILNKCPKLSDISPSDKNNNDIKENITKLQTLSNFIIILSNCMSEIYKFYSELNVLDTNETDDNDNCEIEYDKKDKLVLFDILENSIFKFSDITIELFELVTNDEFKHASGNLFNNEAELYLDEIKKDYLQIIENEKKIINNEKKHKMIWNDNITQIENIQSVIFNLLAHLPKFEMNRSNIVYIIYKLQSIIKDLEENMILSKGEFLNPIQKLPEFSEVHYKRIKQEMELFHNTFNNIINSKLTEKPLLSLILKSVFIFELITYMYKISVNSLTCLDKEDQEIILNSAKNTAISFYNVVINKLGLSKQDIDEISLYLEDCTDLSKFDERLNISESVDEELIEEFYINLKDTEEKLNSTINYKNTISNNTHTLYQNINDLIESVKSCEKEKYSIEISYFEKVCNVFYQTVTEINSNYSDLSEQTRVYKMNDYYNSFKIFSNKIKLINTGDDKKMKEVKKDILKLYNLVTPINIRLKVDIISLIDENKEVPNGLWESIMNDVMNYVSKLQDLCKKENQINIYISPKIQKLNSIEKYFENIYRNNMKELEILNSKKFYHGDIGNIIYYMVSNTLISVHIYIKSLMCKCQKLFLISCNSPLESQMFSFDDNWCDLLINSFMEVNDSIKNLSNIIHKNTSYVKNINILNTLKGLYEILNTLKYISSKKYLLDYDDELWSETAADNAIRSVENSISYMEENTIIKKFEFNMTYVYLYYITFAFFLIFNII